MRKQVLSFTGLPGVNLDTPIDMTYQKSSTQIEFRADGSVSFNEKSAVMDDGFAYSIKTNTGRIIFVRWISTLLETETFPRTHLWEVSAQKEDGTWCSKDELVFGTGVWWYRGGALCHTVK